MKMPDVIRNHKLATALCALAVIIVPTGFALKGRTAEVKYISSPVSRGNITAVVQATGIINPLTTVPVGSFVSGTVQYVFADYNTKVKAGQVLAQLDPSPYEASLVTASGNLNSAIANEQNLEANLQTVQATIQADQANIAKGQSDLTYAQSNGKRMQDLAAQGVMSRDQGDLAISTVAQAQASLQASQAQLAQAKSQYNQAQAQVSQAKAQIQANRGNVAMADTNLRYTTILSPIDGTVVARNVTVGQSVAASLQAPQVFVIAQDLKRMQLYAKTDESDTGAIKVGAEVTFQVDAFPNEQFRGRVSSIHLNATTVQNVVTYDTIIDFENPDEKLLPGETAYVTIPTGRAENALRIPNAALSYTPDLPFSDLQKLYKDNNIRREAYASHLGGWQVVWTQEGQDKKMTPHAVRVGITDYNTTELKEGNLQEGQQVITLQEGGNKAAGGGRNPLNPQQGRGGGGPGGGGRGGR